MAIGEDKTRMTVTMSKVDKKIIEQLANIENRSVNNLINNVLKNYIAEQKSNGII